MNIRLTTPDELSEHELRTWAQFQEQSAEFDSPYFRPEFSQAVARVRDDVEVAVLLEGGDPAGFFPFQRVGTYAAKPVGGRLSDYQAVICRPGFTFDAKDLVRACGLNVWDFDHVLSEQQAFRPYRRFVDLSPYMDLSQGFERYREQLRPSARKELRQTGRLERKITRELGQLRYELSCRDEAAFEQLVQWKSAQYLRSGITNVFGFPWTVKLLREIWSQKSDQFQGVLSTLYAGDKLLAGHFGMRSGGVYHWWFPAYDREYASFAPGRVLLSQTAQACEEHGIRKIDLGRGVAPFKSLAMSGATEVAIGSVDLRHVARRLRNTWRAARELIKNSPLSGPARVPGRIIHRLSEWIEFG